MPGAVSRGIQRRQPRSNTLFPTIINARDNEMSGDNVFAQTYTVVEHTDRRVPQSKDALSRALGAAFLSHQVQQLENTIERGHGAGSRSNNSHGYGGSRGTRRGNEGNARGCASGDRGMQGGGGVGGKRIQGGGNNRQGAGYGGRGAERNCAKHEDRGSDPDDKDKDSHTKDADIVVVDASVLVHAIGELKKWCRSKREEIVIIPLEGASDMASLGISLDC